MIDNLLLFVLLSLIAEICGTVSGFGSSILFVPLAGLFLDFHSVLGITAVFHVTSNLSKIAMFRHGFDMKLIYSLGIPSLVFVGIGAYISKFYVSQHLEIILSLVLILTSIAFYFSRNAVIKPTVFKSVCGGAVSGFIAGIVGTGGAIRGLTLSAFNLQKAVFIATSAAIDLGVDSTRAVVYGLNGYIHTHDLYLIPILLLVALAGTYTGKLILNRFSEKTFRVLVLGMVFITGVSTFISNIL